MKRLFEVAGGQAKGQWFFQSKTVAKEFRRDNGGHVTYGPDHRLFDVKGHPRTHSHNARSGGCGTGFKRKK